MPEPTQREKNIWEKYNLSSWNVKVLEELGYKGDQTFHQLSQQFGYAASLTISLIGLKKKNLVTGPNPKNKCYTLTDDGRVMVEKISAEID